MSTINTIEDQTANTDLDDTDILLVPTSTGVPTKMTIQNFRRELGNQLVSATAATLAVAAATHAGKTVLLDRAGGIAVTLPSATGTGDVYEFVMITTNTSDTTIKVAASSDDVINGAVTLSTDIAGVTISAGVTDDTLTLDGSTTGGIAGSRVVLRDVASGQWVISGDLVSTGVEADPFSATVSS